MSDRVVIVKAKGMRGPGGVGPAELNAAVAAEAAARAAAVAALDAAKETPAGAQAKADAAVAALVGASPAALDTLNELAAALGDDANFASTITAALAGKAPQAALDAEVAARADLEASLPYLVAGTTSAAIQTVLDGLPAYVVGAPLRQVVPSGGEWAVTAPIRVPSGVHLDLSQGGRFRLAAGVNLDVITNSDWVLGNTDIRITGGYLDGNRTNQVNGYPADRGGSVDGPGQSLITLVNVTRGHISGVTGRSPFHHGIDLAVRDTSANSFGDPGCRDVVVSDCAFTDFGDDGITTHFSSRISIAQCVAWLGSGSYSGSSAGIEIDDGSQDVTISGCLTSDCVVGIQVQGHEGRQAARNVSINGCIASTCVYGFRFQQPGAAGAVPAGQVTVKGGSAVNCTNGVTINNYRTTIMDGVTFPGCSKIVSSVSSDSVRSTGTTFTNCEFVAPETLRLTDANMGSLGGIKFVNCTWQGTAGGNQMALIVEKADVRLEACTFRNINHSGVVLQAGALRSSIVNCDFFDFTTGNPIKVDAATNFKIEGCTIHNSAAASGGIMLGFSGAPTGGVIIGNTITGTAYAIRAWANDPVGVLIANNRLVGTTAPTLFGNPGGAAAYAVGTNV